MLEAPDDDLTIVNWKRVRQWLSSFLSSNRRPVSKDESLIPCPNERKDSFRAGTRMRSLRPGQSLDLD